jgi:hypothetical protein
VELVRTSQITHRTSVKKTSRLMVTETISVYPEKQTQTRKSQWVTYRFTERYLGS